MLAVPLPNRSDPAAALNELRLDGVVLTGGNDLGAVSRSPDVAPERDLFEGKLLEACAGSGIPVLGVCRGLQMLVVHHGGMVREIAGHVAVTHPLTVRRPSVVPLREGMVVNSFHNFGVRREDLGPDWEVAATAPDGSVEAIAHRTLRRWGIMWHPERSPGSPEWGEILRGLFGAASR